MNNTPNSLRKHIGIFGDTNSGKSQLFNKIINQPLAVVSDQEGTTTDPVKKAMELIGFGPVVFIDTAGTNDTTTLGKERNKKTYDILNQVDFGIIVVDFKNYNEKTYKTLKENLEKNNTEFLTVISKSDLLDSCEKQDAITKFKNAYFVSSFDEESVDKLKEVLILKLKEEKKEDGLLSGLVNKDDNIVLVIPVDSEAPEGRLILPQVQTIRSCLDIGAYCHICNENNLENLLNKIKAELVITDSQAFKKVNEIVPKNLRLTSFSMLLARQKGDFETLFKSAQAIDSLKDGDFVLISEVCTHNTSHEDIARVKIPNLLKKKTGKEINFEFSSGFSFPEDLEKYSLIIHCGGCMITKKAMESRIKTVKEKRIPITNFGVILAYLTGAYERQKFYFQ
ncbi:MAG: [Clostridia bacterium]|nr:[FeFe] hydrogenase H-cluster maturation GTPase HydF [Clostridia bacterium]